MNSRLQHLFVIAVLATVSCRAKSSSTPQAAPPKTETPAPGATARSERSKPPTQTATATPQLPAPVPEAPAEKADAQTEQQKKMAAAAIAFAEALGRRDLAAAEGQLMGPEVCAEAPDKQRAQCEQRIKQQKPVIHAGLPKLAKNFAAGFRVKDVSFEPLPGMGGLDGALVHLHPQAKEHTEQALMVGLMHGKAYVLIAMPAERAQAAQPKH